MSEKSREKITFADRMRRFLYILLQCTWGLPQTLAGAVLWLVFAGSRHFRYREAVATQWPLRGGISLGLFIFVSDTTLCYHEYGHTLQSLILGPLYLPFVGLPSLLWAGCYRLFRIRRAYVSVYPENWAEHLGRPSLRLDRVSGGAGRVRAPGRRG